MKLRRALPFVAAAALLVGLAPVVASGAPKNTKPGTSLPQSKPPVPAPTPTQPLEPTPPPAGADFIVLDGFISGMNIQPDGRISEMSVRVTGRAADAPHERVAGCGLEQAKNPVLLMMFERYQRVWINVRKSDGCYLGMLVNSPNKP